MFWLILIVAVLLMIAALPFVFEALRAPMDDNLRAEASGSYVETTRGLTHYEWHGPRSDRVLVLVHGLTTPAWVFSGLIRGLLMMRYRVLAFDLYGRGFSDRPAGAQDITFFSHQLRDLIDELGINVPVTLLGYSMGGAIATAFAAAEPDRVERLILLAPAGVKQDPGPLLRLARDRGWFGTWLWGLLGGFSIARQAKRAAAGPTVLPDLAGRMARELNTKGYLPAVLSSVRNALSGDLEKVHRELAAMYIPTLAIWGEADTTIPLAAMGQFAQWNRQARQEVVPNAGHGLVHANPKEVIAAIHTFLREVPNV